MVSESERPLKVALILSGAVALGSYEAGVACELLTAMALGAPITLDLIAGSSAGAMIAAMVVKTLVAGESPAVLENWSTYDLNLLTSHYETACQAARHHKPVDEGLLSSEAVRRLIAQFARHSRRDPAFRPHYPAATVGLVLTLTNLDGLPGIGSATDLGHFGEAVTFTLSPSDPAQPSRNRWERAVWERIGLVARASAAFPGAFDPESVPYADRLCLPQVQEQWANSARLDRLAEERPGLQERMLYADGGIMDNRPLERALAALPGLTPPEHLRCLVFDPHRCFLLVEPEPPLRSYRTPHLQRTLPDTFSRSLQILESSLTIEAASRRALETNARLVTLFRFLAGLARRLDGGGPPPHAELLAAPAPPHFAPAVHAFYRWLVDPDLPADTAWLRRTSDPYRADRSALLAALETLRDAYLPLTEDERSHLRQAHIALGSQLGLTQPWLLVTDLIPDQSGVRLYGGEIGHFAAFLTRAYLAHDFAAGRYYARRWLAAVLPEWDGPLRPAPPPIRGGLDLDLLLANRRPLARVAGRGLAALARAGLDLPAALRRTLRAAAWLLVGGTMLQLIIWVVIAWLGLREEPGADGLRALALAAGAGLVPLAAGFAAGLLVPRRLLAGLLRRLARPGNPQPPGA